MASGSLIKPHGGALVEAVLRGAEGELLEARAGDLAPVTLGDRELLDLELIASGGASPLRGFMGQRDYRSVLDGQRLASGSLFPVPITLPVPVERLGVLAPGTEVALRDDQGALRGALAVNDTFVRDVQEEARLVHGTDDPGHPGAAHVLSRPRGTLGGEVVLLRPRELRFETAREVRLRLAQHGFYRVAAGLTASLPEAASAARQSADALLVQSIAGQVALDARFPVVVAHLPVPSRHAGPREALFRALVLRNYGVSHIVLGASRTDLATADAIVRFRDELGLTVVIGDRARMERAASDGVASSSSRAAA